MVIYVIDIFNLMIVYLSMMYQVPNIYLTTMKNSFKIVFSHLIIAIQLKIKLF